MTVTPSNDRQTVQISERVESVSTRTAKNTVEAKSQTTLEIVEQRQSVAVDERNTIVEIPTLSVTVSTKGTQGIPGEDGEGVPEGGTEGQILAKKSNDDFDAEWIDPETAGAGNLSDLGDVDTSTADIGEVFMKGPDGVYRFYPVGTSFAFAIGSFTQSGIASLTIPIGVGQWLGIGDVTFTATAVNGPPDSGYVSVSGWNNLVMANNGLGPTQNTQTMNYLSLPGTVTFRLNLTKGGTTLTRDIVVNQHNYRGWGKLSKGSGFTQEDIASLTVDLSNSRAKSIGNQTYGENEWFWWISPVRLGVPSFKDNNTGFAMDMGTRETVSLTFNGFTEYFYAVPATYANIGLVSPTVS